jgi:alpha/beta superfamily hydrolase
VNEGRISFPSRDGLSLEGSLDVPAEARSCLVICHPHPRMGGTMDAPLLVALRDEMTSRGWAVTRFNFRGVGSSEGAFATGEDEVADAGGALDFTRRRLGDMPVALAGWSFGGAVALRVVAAEPDVAACVVIAPAIAPKSGVTAGLPDPGNLRIQAPVLVICVSNDEQVSPADCRALADQLPNARYVEVPGANHFFWAKYDVLTHTVATFLDAVV